MVNLLHIGTFIEILKHKLFIISITFIETNIQFFVGLYGLLLGINFDIESEPLIDSLKASDNPIAKLALKNLPSNAKESNVSHKHLRFYFIFFSIDITIDNAFYTIHTKLSLYFLTPIVSKNIKLYSKSIRHLKPDTPIVLDSSCAPEDLLNHLPSLENCIQCNIKESCLTSVTNNKDIN